MNMKRFLALTLAVLMVLGLCACGNDDSSNGAATEPTKGGDKAPATTPVGYTFTYKDYQFGVGMSVEAVLENLGEPVQKIESESCAFGGKDTVYYYSGIQISTNDEDGYEKIYSIYLEDDLTATEKNVSVGNTADQVKAAYGEPGSNSTENCLIYAKAGMYLKFILKDNKVSSITYTTLA
jgi:hypothetical protein